jgi:hypothetical protein
VQYSLLAGFFFFGVFSSLSREALGVGVDEQELSLSAFSTSGDFLFDTE